MNRSWTFAAIALLALGIVGCVDREAQKQAARTKTIIEDTTVPVQVQTVGTTTVSDNLEITGQVTTSSDVTVGARTAGRVVSVSVRDGDSVRAGQVIAQQETQILYAAVQQAQGQLSAARSNYDQARSNAIVGPQKSLNAIRSAEAELRSARAQLAKAKIGARPEEISQAQTQVNSAKFAMETARKEMERQKTLFESGAVSRQRLEQAENAYQNALGNYEQALENLQMKRSWSRPEDIRSAEEDVRQAEEGVRTAQANKKLDVLLNQQVDAARSNMQAAKANLDIANRNLSDAVIRSPFAGRVSGNPVQPGTFLAPGSPVARLIGAEGIYFEGEVPESNIAAVVPGKMVQVNIDAFPNRTWVGKVAAVSPTGDQVGRLFRVRIQLAGATQEIKPGMFARGVVTLRSVADATVVPTAAVMRDEDQTYIFVVEGTKAKRLVVRTGLSADGKIQVTGVPAGAKVVVQGQNQLTDGAAVRLEVPKAAQSGEGKTDGV